jgi:DNA-binding beta-propeller fold protein YncE
MTATEDRLREALAAAAATVREDTLRPLTVPERRARRWPRLFAPVAAAAAVVLIVAVAAGIGRMPAPRPRSHAAIPAALNVRFGQIPTGVALDAANGTMYVSAWREGRSPSSLGGTVAMVNVATCNASDIRGCTRVSHVSRGARAPNGIALDERTHTLYVASDIPTSAVAVLNTATCNAVTTRGCTSNPPLVSTAPGVTGPATLAINPLTDTVYAIYARSNQLSVINGRTCNAADLSGCGRAVTTVPIGSPPGSAAGGQQSYSAVAVDPATNTVYIGTWSGDLLVIDGRTCDGADIRGCGKVLATVPVASAPSSIAVDQAAGTLYVTGAGPSLVSVISTRTCSARDVAGCAGRLITARGGVDPLAADEASHTLYLADGGENTVSMINAAACSATRVSGCGRLPASFPAGSGPQLLAADSGRHTLYVVGSATLSVISTAACNAVGTRGCPTRSPAGTVAPGAGRNPVYWCDSDLIAYESGEPAGPLIKGSARVASGAGWSLWAKRGIPDPYGIEQGGVVLNGRWYGLCGAPLSAGPGAGFELIDTGGHGVVYGFIQHPYRVAITLSSGGRRLPVSSVLLRGTTFFIARLPRPACSYRGMTLRARASAGPAWSGSSTVTFGSCVPGTLVSTSEGNSTWGPGAGN